MSISKRTRLNFKLHKGNQIKGGHAVYKLIIDLSSVFCGKYEHFYSDKIVHLKFLRIIWLWTLDLLTLNSEQTTIRYSKCH